MKDLSFVSVEGKLLKLTNLNKVFFPRTGFTKRDLIRYYRQVGPTALPHLRDRPFTFRRFPNGVEGDSFFEKQCPHHRPRWVQTGDLGNVHHCLVNDLATLIWAANLGAIELHTTLAKIRDTQRPTLVAFDLDPGEGAGLTECAEAALRLRSVLRRHRLECFAKTSGKKGLHVYVPLNSPADFRQTKAFARTVAVALQAQDPSLITSRMSKQLRVGKVFVDWSQNTDFKTTATAYSLRATDLPVVSTPITWKELQLALKRTSRINALLAFDPQEVISRIHRRGDLFAPVLGLKQALPELRLGRFRDLHVA